MDKDTTVFEIKVQGLQDFMSFINQLKASNKEIVDIIRATDAADVKDDINRKNRLQRRQQDRLDESSSIRATARAEAIEIQATAKALIDKEKALAVAQKATDAHNLAVTRATNNQKTFSTSLLNTNQLLGAFGIAVGVSSLGEFAKNIFDAQSQIEALRLTLKNLLGATSGASLFKQLQDFTTRTPFTFQETIASVNALVGSMKAAGVASSEIAKSVIPTLESLGNSASALGGGDRLGRLVYAFTQVQAAGRLMGTEVRQIAETGFPLLSVLSERLGISVNQVREKISAGAITFDIFKDAMLSAGKEGGVFAGSMTILSQTVSGKIAILKDNVFFAMARVGEAFSGTAKKALDFVTGLVTALTGTNFALQKTMDVVKTLIATFVAYKVTLIDTAIIEKAGLIIRGQYILLTATLTGTTNGLSMASLRAAVAARALNTAFLANPFTAVSLIIGTVITALVLMREEQDKLKNETKEALIPLEQEKASFNSLTNAVLKKTLSHEQELEILKKLKKEHPDLIGNTKSLAEAEKILNANKIKTNSAYSFREQKLEILKNQFPIQLKGINTLEEAEAKLGKVIRQTNVDFLLRGRLIENEIRTNFNNKIITDNLTEVIELESKLNKIKKEGISFVAGTAGNITTIAGTQEIAELQSKINKRRAVVQDGLKKNEHIEEDSFNTRKRLTFKYEEDTTKITNEGNKVKTDNTKKAHKEVEDLTQKHLTKLAKEEDDANKSTIKTKKEIADSVRKLENEIRVQSLKIRQSEELENAQSEEDKLKIKKKYHELAWQEALRAWKESNKIAELEKQELEDFALREKKRYAVSVAGNKDREILVKAFSTRMDAITKDGTTKIEKEQLGSYKTLMDAREKYNNGIITDEKALKKELEKLDKERQKDQVKLIATIAELEDKARILERVSKAKNSREIIAIEIDEKNKIIAEKKARLREELRLVDERLTQLEIAGQQETTEYKELAIEKIRIEKATTEEQILQTENLTKKKKDGLKQQSIDFRDAMNFIQDLAGGFFDLFDSLIEQSLDKTSGVVQKAMIENQKAGLEMAKKGASALADFASGNYIGAAFKGLSLGLDLIQAKNKKAHRLAVAEMALATQALENYLSVVEVAVDNVLAKFETIKTVYGEIKTANGAFVNGLVADFALQETLKSLLAVRNELSKGIAINPKILENFSFDQLLQGEIARAEQIQKNYEKAVSNAQALFEKEKASIEATFDEKKRTVDSTYDAEIKRITDVYNAEIAAIDKRYVYEQEKANQQYAIQTLAIVAQGSAQLEALITNEQSLSSVRAEFAAKRLEIEKAFPLASRAITEGMSAAEVKAINDSIDARDKAFANLQSKYNEELVAIVNSEGQKRKEYTSTEVIQNEIRDRLELASIAFQAAEIERVRIREEALAAATTARDIAELTALSIKNAAILVLETDKNKAIAESTATLNTTLVSLEEAKNKAIGDSFTLLKGLLIAQSIEIGEALKNSAAKGSEAYRKLEEDLIRIKELLTQLSYGIVTFPTLPSVPRPSAEVGNFAGTDNTSSEGSRKRKVDSRGGFFTVIHPSEQIYSKQQMDELTRANGGVRPSREDVMQKFIGYTQMSKITTPNYNNWVIDKMPNNMRLEKEIRSLNSKMTKFASIVANSPKVINQIDKTGFSTFLSSKNKNIEVRRNRFKHTG
jgi:tape measure domain-containing protein